MSPGSEAGLTRLAEGRLDDEALTLSTSVLAKKLQEALGQRTGADLIGLGDSRQLGRYQKGDGPNPRPIVEMRLREAYKLVGMITSTFSAEVARSWLLGTNSALDDRAPIELFREASTPEEFRKVRSLARRFVVFESAVRDPLEDIDSVRAARRRPMSERLELALSWNLAVSELRAGLLEMKTDDRPI